MNNPTLSQFSGLTIGKVMVYEYDFIDHIHQLIFESHSLDSATLEETSAEYNRQRDFFMSHDYFVVRIEACKDALKIYVE